MGKYAPSVKWTPSGRAQRVVCGMCPDAKISPTVLGARAHLLAHRDHIVALVTEVTTLLSIMDSDDEVTATSLNLTNAGVFRVEA